MKPFHILGIICFVAPIAQVACLSQNETFIAEEIEKIPSCGLTCLEITIPAVGCDLLNTTCQCSSERLVKITAQCMLANCTLAEMVEVDKIQAAICERPYQSRNHEIRVMTIVCAIITNTAVALRLITRSLLNQPYRLDDFFIIAATSTDAVFMTFGIQLEHHGFGEHVWEIDISIIPQLLYWFFLCEIFYVLTIALIKVSILILYLQVFPTRTFQLRCWSVLAFVIASSLAFTATTIFQCHPVSYAWSKNTHGGTCINFNSVTWVNSGMNILQDLLIIALPISEIRKLRLEQKKKIGLYIVFGLGGFVCVASIIRIHTVKTFGITADPTWDNIPITFWSTMEITTAMLCPCLPTIRSGLVRLFPQAFGSPTHASTSRSTMTGHKNAILVQKSFASSSAANSWPAQKLASMSSLNMRGDEATCSEIYSEAIKDLELAKLNSDRFDKS